MGVRTWTFLLAAALTSAAPATDAAAAQRGRGRPELTQPDRGGEKLARVAPLREARSTLQRTPRSYREPAFASGYDDGYAKGLADGTEGARYDPVRHVDYRDGERGYRESYGSREAYRNNYRAGFRQGYEDGYRLGTRNRS